MKKPDFYPESVAQITHNLFFTAYLSAKTSSETTKKRAEALQKFIGGRHVFTEINGIYEVCKDFIREVYELDPKFKAEGGSYIEDVSL